MAWIETVPDDEWTGQLGDMYADGRGRLGEVRTVGHQ